MRRVWPISLKGLVLGAVAGLVLFRCLAITAANFRAAQKYIARDQILKVAGALELFRDVEGRCPRSGAELLEDRALEDPRDLVDPWGTNIAYSCSDAGVQVRSAGRDKTFETLDDITNER